MRIRPATKRSAFFSLPISSSHLLPLIIVGLLTLCVALVQGWAGLANTNFAKGDALAPFSILDQFYAGESVDLSRQGWLLPLLLGNLLRLIGSDLSYHQLFDALATVTALSGAATLPLTYVLARRWCGPFESLIPVALLAINTSFFLHSVIPNPTQVYVLCFMATLVAVDRRAWGAALAIATVSVLIRYEGMLLLLLVAGWITAASLRRTAPRFLLYVAPVSAVLAIAAILCVQVTSSSIPLGFLKNTNAMQAPPVHFSHRLVSALAWKFDKLHAFGVNMTMGGMILAAIGGALMPATVVVFSAMYWLGYEAVMLVYTLAVPIGAATPKFAEIVLTPPVPRYYQVFTPPLLILAYVGLREISRPSGRAQVAVIGLTLVLYAIHQVATAANSYAADYYGYARSGVAADLVGAAEFVRSTGSRNAEVVIAQQDGEGLVYLDRPGGTAAPQLHPFFFSIISGRNRTNCTGYNLVNPNLYCSAIASSNIVDLDRLPLGERADFAVVRKPSNEIGGFDLAFQNDSFAVWRRP
jgi:hypothetical protein